MVVRASCHDCNRVVNFHSPTTLDEVQEDPPFQNQKCATGKQHNWIIKEITLGK